MSGKRRHQQQQYGARRMTKAYQLNMMVEEREKEKKAQESAKRQKYLSIGGTIAFTVVLIVCIIQSWLIPGIIVGCGFAGFAAYIYLHGRKMQKESIMHMKEQGYTKRMLLQTDMMIYEISQRVGYSDIRYFSQTFARYTGVRPKEYRNKQTH